jgi:hypothetical protein
MLATIHFRSFYFSCCYIYGREIGFTQITGVSDESGEMNIQT